MLRSPKDRTKVEDQTGVVSTFHVGVATKFMLVKPRGQSESVLKNTVKIANNLSAVAEHHQKTGHESDLDNVKVLCREDKLLPLKVHEAIFIKKETINRDGGVNFQKSMIHF